MRGRGLSRRGRVTLQTPLTHHRRPNIRSRHDGGRYALYRIRAFAASIPERVLCTRAKVVLHECRIHVLSCTPANPKRRNIADLRGLHKSCRVNRREACIQILQRYNGICYSYYDRDSGRARLLHGFFQFFVLGPHIGCESRLQCSKLVPAPRFSM